MKVMQAPAGVVLVFEEPHEIQFAAELLEALGTKADTPEQRIAFTKGAAQVRAIAFKQLQ